MRIRGSRPGDEPKVTNRGTRRAASYTWSASSQRAISCGCPAARLPRPTAAELKDYFDRLAADGAESLTAPRGDFGLTEKEMTAVLADLAQPIDFETKGLTPRGFIDRLQTKLSLKPSVDAEAEQALRTAAPAVDELTGVSAGTALAMTLRNCGLVMRPEKRAASRWPIELWQPSQDVIRGRTLGKMTSPNMQYWPVGWEPEKSPGEIAPALFRIKKRRNRRLQFGRSASCDRSATKDAGLL